MIRKEWLKISCKMLPKVGFKSKNYTAGKKIRELKIFCSILRGIRTLLVAAYECFLDHSKQNSNDATSRVPNPRRIVRKIHNSLNSFLLEE